MFSREGRRPDSAATQTEQGHGERHDVVCGESGRPGGRGVAARAVHAVCARAQRPAAEGPCQRQATGLWVCDLLHGGGRAVRAAAGKRDVALQQDSACEQGQQGPGPGQRSQTVKRRRRHEKDDEREKSFTFDGLETLFLLVSAVCWPAETAEEQDRTSQNEPEHRHRTVAEPRRGRPEGGARVHPAGIVQGKDPDVRDTVHGHVFQEVCHAGHHNGHVGSGRGTVHRQLSQPLLGHQHQGRPAAPVSAEMTGQLHYVCTPCVDIM